MGFAATSMRFAILSAPQHEVLTVPFMDYIHMALGSKGIVL